MSDVLQVRLDRVASPADGVVVLEFAGELDLSVSNRFTALVGDLTGDEPRGVIVDLARVGFLDSTMLRELLRAHRALEERGCRFVLADPQSAVARLLQLTGTDEVFTIASDRDEALRQIR